MNEFSKGQYTPPRLKFPIRTVQEFWKPPFKQNSKNQKASFGHLSIGPQPQQEHVQDFSTRSQEALLSVGSTSHCICNQKPGFLSSALYADPSPAETVPVQFFIQPAHSQASPHRESSVGGKPSRLKAQTSIDTTHPNSVRGFQDAFSINYTFNDNTPLDLSAKKYHVAVDSHGIKESKMGQIKHDVNHPNLSILSLSRIEVIEATTTHHESTVNEHCNKNKLVMLSDDAKIGAQEKEVSTTDVLKDVHKGVAPDTTNVSRQESVAPLPVRPLIYVNEDEYLGLSSNGSDYRDVFFANCTDDVGDLDLGDGFGSNTEEIEMFSSVARSSSPFNDTLSIISEISGTSGNLVLSNAADGVGDDSEKTKSIRSVAFKDVPLFENETVNTRSDEPLSVWPMISSKPTKLGVTHSPVCNRNRETARISNEHSKDLARSKYEEQFLTAVKMILQRKDKCHNPNTALKKLTKKEVKRCTRKKKSTIQQDSRKKNRKEVIVENKARKKENKIKSNPQSDRLSSFCLKPLHADQDCSTLCKSYKPLINQQQPEPAATVISGTPETICKPEGANANIKMDIGKEDDRGIVCSRTHTTVVANVSKSLVDRDRSDRSPSSDAIKVSKHTKKDRKRYFQLKQKQKHKKRVKKSKEHSNNLHSKYKNHGNQIVIEHEVHDKYPMSSSSNIEKEKQCERRELGVNVYIAERGGNITKSNKMVKVSSRHGQGARYTELSRRKARKKKKSKREHRNFERVLQSSEESSSKTKHKRHRHIHKTGIKEQILGNNQGKVNALKSNISTKVLTETLSKNETVTTSENKMSSSIRSSTKTPSTHVNSRTKCLEKESCDRDKSSMLSTGYSVINNITETQFCFPIMDRMSLVENVNLDISNDDMENTGESNTLRPSQDSLTVTGTTLTSAEPTIDHPNLQNLDECENKLNLGKVQKDCSFEDFSCSSKTFNDVIVKNSVLNPRVADKQLLKIQIALTDSQEQCASTDDYRNNSKTKSDSVLLTNTKHAFQVPKTEDIFTKNIKSRDVKNGSQCSNAREQIESYIDKPKFRECTVNTPNNVKSNASEIFLLGSSSNSRILNREMYSVNEKTSLKRSKRKGCTNRIKRKSEKDVEDHLSLVNNVPWDVFKIDVNSVRYEQLLPERVMAALVDSPSKDNGNKQAERLYFRNDPRVQCYLGLFKSSDKKLDKTKAPGCFASDSDSKQNLNKHGNTPLIMQSSVDQTAQIRNKYTKSIPIGVCSDSTTVDMNDDTQKSHAPNSGKFRVIKEKSRPIRKKDVGADSETSHMQRFPVNKALLSEYIPNVVSSNNSSMVEIETQVTDYPEEREDIYDPRWKTYLCSNSEGVAFQSIRQKWQRNPEEKLNKNLTVQTYRHNRLQLEKTEWASGKRKRNSEQDLYFSFGQPAAKVSKISKPSTFLQDKEIEEKNAELHQMVSKLKNTTLCTLDVLGKEYEENCKKLTDQLSICNQRHKLEETVKVVKEKFHKRYHKILNFFEHEVNEIEEIKAEIAKHERYCENEFMNWVTEEERSDFQQGYDIIKNMHTFYAKF